MEKKEFLGTSSPSYSIERINVIERSHSFDYIASDEKIDSDSSANN